jgi:hypothetical protein
MRVSTNEKTMAPRDTVDNHRVAIEDDRVVADERMISSAQDQVWSSLCRHVVTLTRLWIRLCDDDPQVRRDSTHLDEEVARLIWRRSP